MNKKGIGMGPAIAVSVILLAMFFLITYFSLSMGKVSIVKTAEADADSLEVNELLLDILETDVEKLNVADLIVLKKFDEVENVVKSKLPDTGWSFRVYGPDFKNTVQSDALYSLGDEGEVEVFENIKNYYREDLIVYLSVKNE